MRNTLCATALVALALLGTGCKKASPIVGKWSQSAGQISMTFDFKPENTFSMAMGIMGKTINLTGDYKLEGEALTLTLKDVNVPGATAAQAAQLKKQSASQMGKAETLTVKFPTEDQMSLTSTSGGGTFAGPAGGTTTLTRVKEGA